MPWGQPNVSNKLQNLGSVLPRPALLCDSRKHSWLPPRRLPHCPGSQVVAELPQILSTNSFFLNINQSLSVIELKTMIDNTESRSLQPSTVQSSHLLIPKGSYSTHDHISHLAWCYSAIKVNILYFMYMFT